MTHTPHNRARYIVLLGNLFFSFSLAITAYVNSSFIEKFVGELGVGLLYAIAAVATILALTNATKLLGRIGNRTFFLLYGTVHALSLATLTLPFDNVSIRIIAFVAYIFSGNVLIFSFDIFFDHVAGIAGRGKMRGLYLLLSNCGWVLAPMISAQALDLFSYAGMYTLALLIFVFLVVFLEWGLKGYTDAHYHQDKRGSGVLQAFKKARLRPVLWANFLLQFFYVWMVIYTPIYLSEYLHLSWDSIGIIFTLMLTAFVILDYPLGWIADKLGSEKELTVVGFFIMMVSVFGLAVVTTPSMLTIGILLFMSRVGAATVEAMTEIHFFKIVKDTEPELISVLCDLRPLSYIVAPIAGIVIMALFPFTLIFGILGILMIAGIYIATKLERNHTWWKRAHKA